VEAVGLEEFAAGAEGGEEVHHGNRVPLAQVVIEAVEIVGVGAVVGRQAWGHEDDRGAIVARLLDHGLEIDSQVAQGQTAQAVVGAEGNDDDGGPVALEQSGKT